MIIVIATGRNVGLAEGIIDDTCLVKCCYCFFKVPTYETAATRQYFDSRTETIRSCSNEMVQFCQTMQAFPKDKEKQLRQLITAMEKHGRLMLEASNGQGIDRHLLGLAVMAIENDEMVRKMYICSYSSNIL